MLPVNFLCLNELSCAPVSGFLHGWMEGSAGRAGRQGWVALGGLVDAQPCGAAAWFSRGKAEHPLVIAGSCVPGITFFSLYEGAMPSTEQDDLFTVLKAVLFSWHLHSSHQGTACLASL